MQIKYTRHITGWLLVVALLVSAVLPLQGAHAQDGDEPDTGRIFGYRTETIFPAAIRFVVGLNARLEEIESAVLVVRQGGTFERTFTLDPALTQIADQSTDVVTQLAYVWDLADTPVPHLFEAVSFEWLVTTADGELSRASGQFIFVDDAPDLWQKAGQPPLVLHWLNPVLAGDTMRDELLPVRSLLVHYTQVSPRFEFAIYDPQVRLCDEEISPDTGETISVVVGRDTGGQYPCSPALYRQLYAATGIIFVQRQTFGYSELQDTLIHEMTSQTYEQVWGGTLVPAWFGAGLGALLRLHPDIAALDVIRDVARTDTLLDFSVLAASLPDDTPYQQRALWERESYLLVLYLADRYGMDAPFEMALDITRQPDGFEGALHALTGGDLAALWSDWLRWLFGDSAASAVGWTPYTATTPTPTVIPTATVLPPTSTPINTPLPTMIPTSTFLADQPPTVNVQRVTATRFPTTTNTPLPPGSLPTAIARTPVPSASEGQGDSNALITAGLIGLVVVGVGMLLVGAWMMVRRRD